MIDILSAETLKKENERLSTEYKKELKAKITEVVERVTKPGESNWEFNMLNFTKDGVFTIGLDDVAFSEIGKELEALGYHVSFDERMFRWSINEIH